MIFSELDHRLSVVKRWGIVHTIQTQSVAEHVCNVTRIADRIAFSWFGITDAWVLLEINRHAQHHDDLESVAGDAPSMIKDCIDEKALRERYMDLIPTLGNRVSLVAQQVVKIADIIEAILFLNIEVSLGNNSVRDILTHHEERLERYLADNKLPYWGKFVAFMIEFFPRGAYYSQPYDRRDNGTERGTAPRFAEI